MIKLIIHTILNCFLVWLHGCFFIWNQQCEWKSIHALQCSIVSEKMQTFSKELSIEITTQTASMCPLLIVFIKWLAVFLLNQTFTIWNAKFSHKDPKAIMLYINAFQVFIPKHVFQNGFFTVQFLFVEKACYR